MSVRLRHADSVARAHVGPSFERSGREFRDGDRQLGVAQGSKLLASAATGRDRGQALLGVAAMLLDVHGRHCRDRCSAVGVQATPVAQVIRQGPGLFVRPGLERRDELSLIDQADLQRDQPKQEIMVGTCHGMAPRQSIGPRITVARDSSVLALGSSGTKSLRKLFAVLRYIM